MPDLDRIERALAPNWRRPYRLIINDLATHEEVAAACLASLARSLRENEGIQGLADLAAVVEDTRRRLNDPHDDPLSRRVVHRESLAQIDGVARRYRHDHTQMAARKAKSLVNMMVHGSTREGRDVGLLLASEACWEITKHHLFSRLLGGSRDRSQSATDLYEYQQTIWQATQGGRDSLARSLMRDNSAHKIRKPRSIRRRVSTAEMLQEDLLG